MAKEVRSREDKKMSKSRKTWMECRGKSVGTKKGSTRITLCCKKGIGREKHGWGSSNFQTVEVLEMVFIYDPLYYGTSPSVLITGFSRAKPSPLSVLWCMYGEESSTPSKLNLSPQSKSVSNLFFFFLKEMLST